MKLQKTGIFAITLAVCMVAALMPTTVLIPILATPVMSIAAAADEAADIDAVSDDLGADTRSDYDASEEALDDAGTAITDDYNDLEADADEAGQDIEATNIYQDFEEEVDDAGQNWFTIAIIAFAVAAVGVGIYYFAKRKK